MDYFFWMIKATWGDMLYVKHFGDAADLANFKKSWAEQLLGYLITRERDGETEQDKNLRERLRIDRMFENIRGAQSGPRSKDFLFPSLPAIIGVLDEFRQQEKFEQASTLRLQQRKPVDLSAEAIAKRKAQGKPAIDGLKSLFGGA